MVEFALCLTPGIEAMWALGKQMGVDRAVGMFPRPLDPGAYPLWERDVVVRMKGLYESRGYELSVIEGRWIPMEQVKLGTAARDAEIERAIAAVRNLGEMGIPVWCYNFQSYFGARRTSRTIPTRGNALATGYIREDDSIHDAGGTPPVSHARLWENYKYFLARVLPEAEKAKVKMALHPDDPPLAEVAGVPRIFTSVAAFEEAFSLYESEYHGACFCQANFALMGADIPETIRAFAKTGRLNFVHFRDIRGQPQNFVETFHDDGQTDMAAAMKAYLDSGFSGVMRPDHAPSMAGEANLRPGYEELGKLFAIGYMKGLREALLSERQTAGV